MIALDNYSVLQITKNTRGLKMNKPLSKEFLLKRGYCCGNKCRNCPYIPKHIKGNREKQMTKLQKLTFTQQ